MKFSLSYSVRQDVLAPETYQGKPFNLKEVDHAELWPKADVFLAPADPGDRESETILFANDADVTPGAHSGNNWQLQK